MKKFVVVPTYNESLNIGKLLTRILDLKIADLNVLVVDDRSPDGTSKIVAEFAKQHSEIKLAERIDDRGRGTAGIFGFHLALKLGAEVVAEMDADFSHPPEDLPRLFDKLTEADIVIASRLMPGSIDQRPWSRKVITRFANRYARFFLEMSSHHSRVLDWTTGFRVYKKRVFEAVPLEKLVSQGPSILQEILFRALNAGMTAVEVPFHMVDRAAGVSTFNKKIARQSFLSVPCYRILFGSNPTPFRLLSCREELQAPGYYVISNQIHL